MLPHGERRSRPRDRANSFQIRKRLIFFTAGVIGAVFVVISLQFYSLWTNYQTAFGRDSFTQKWLDRKLVNYSLDTVDALNALQRLESAALRYSLKDTSLDALVARRRQLNAMMDHFKPHSVLWNELRMIESYDEAYSDALAFIESVHQYELGRVGIDAVIESGETSISSWALFKTESTQQEFMLRDKMERTVREFRPVADSSLPVFLFLSCFSVVLYVLGVYAVSQLINIQHRRYARFELLVASISHDLKSPLQALQSASYLLSSSLSAAERHKYAGIVTSSIKTLSRLIDDISMAPDGQTQSLQMAYVDLKKWFSEFIPAYQDKAASKGLELLFKIEMDNVFVEVDPDRMAQGVGNLIDNAIKYTPHGAVEVSVKLRGQEDSEHRRHLIVKVKDTGVGIAQADMERIFRPFERVIPPGLQQPNGMGLGLSIVKRMAQSYPGGKITVQSNVGKGSLFRLNLPVRTCVDANSKPFAGLAADSEIDVFEAGDSIGSKEILVVDDDPNICAAIVGILHEAGFSVDTATNGADALMKLSDQAYKTVITDIQMPHMGGFELAKRIRAIVQPSPYLIAMTAYTSVLNEDPRAAVFDAIVSKPFDELTLVQVVEKGMEGDQNPII